MVRRIDRTGSKQRHYHRLQKQLQRAAESDANRQTADPTLWPGIADLVPRSSRPPSPSQDQHRAQEGGHQGPCGDDEDCEDSERSESTQAIGETIIRWKCEARIDRSLNALRRWSRYPARHAETLLFVSSD